MFTDFVKSNNLGGSGDNIPDQLTKEDIQNISNVLKFIKQASDLSKQEGLE